MKAVARPRRAKIGRKSRLLRKALTWLAVGLICFYGLIAFSLILLRWIDPFTTAVQAERRIESWSQPGTYQKHYQFVPLERISLGLQHAVIAAEDARFYQHHGFDWKEIGNAVEEDFEEGRSRGASTITQQLVKNLFLSTGHSFIRKGIEFSIVPLAELILGKRRILELYLNIVEWGPGVYGAEAASRRYYSEPAVSLSREQGAELAALLPAPLRRKPGHSSAYTARILLHMRQVGW